MTDAPDHRRLGLRFVTLACACGAVLELPPAAAQAARAPWARIHSGAGHREVDADTARRARTEGTFEGFVAASRVARP